MPKEVAWLPQAALDRMHAELIHDADVTRGQLAERIIQDAAPLAAYSVVDLAVNAEDDAVRLNAARYVLDRELGKPKTTTNLNVQADNPILKIIDGVMVERGFGAQNPVSVANDPEDDGTEEYHQESPYQTGTVIDQVPYSTTGEKFAPPYNPEDPTE